MGALTPACRRCDRAADGGRGLCEKHWAAEKAKLVAMGRWDPDRLDPGPAREHLAALRSWGMGTRRVERLTGLARPTIQSIPTAKWVTRRTEDAILSIPLPTSVFDPVLAPGTQIDSLGSRRRLRALTAIGWDGERLANMLGLSRNQVNAITSGRQPKITVAHARTIADLFNRLQMTPGPSAKARRVAQLKGWPLPLQWDEDDMDNPKAKAYTNRERFVFTSERIAELQYLGITDEKEMAARLGIKRESLVRQLSRMADRDQDLVVAS